MRIDTAVASDSPVWKRPYFSPPNGKRWPNTSDWTSVEWTSWLQQSGWNDAAITQYLTEDRYRFGYGLMPDGSLADGPSDNATWLYLPTPKGVTLHQTRISECPNTVWGGAVGGTKSYSALWEAITCSDREDSYRAIIMRRELEELRRTHIDRAETFIAKINQQRGDESIKLTKQPNQLVFKRTNSKVLFGHCNALGDERKYLSEEYDLFIADQAEGFYPDQLVGVAGRLRRTKPTIEPRAIYLPNPGGPAHDWLLSHAITKQVSGDPLYDPNDWTFISARLYDNPFLMDADGYYTTYEKRLTAHKETRRAQLLDGDWTAVVGQFFEDYDADASVRRVTLPPNCAVEVWFRSGEGGKVPYACWAITLPDNRIHVVAELLMPHLTIAKCAQAIVKATGTVLDAVKGTWKRSLASADLFPEKPETGESPSETCRRNGLYVQRGDANEGFGWTRLKHWFSRHPLAGMPWLTIDPDCAFLRHTLGSLIADPTAPDLLDAEGETQAAHALRIGVMARPTPHEAIIAQMRPPTGIGEIHSMVRNAMGQTPRRGGMVR